jgi:lipoate-protein ligase A
MDLIDLTLPVPGKNLALDEALLARAESASASGGAPREALRFWESPVPFVVLGVSGKLAEVKISACEEAGVEVLRRSSGGGTVLQGPGCLNFALVLSLDERPELRDVTRSYAEILGRISRALGGGIEPAGTSDLAQGGMKFSGNAQKRTRKWLLHHGTVLLAFDLELIERFLEEPGKQPPYRERRRHRDFLANLGLSSAEAKRRIAAAWDAAPMPDQDLPDLAPLLAERHANPEWTRRF